MSLYWWVAFGTGE